MMCVRLRGICAQTKQIDYYKTAFKDDDDISTAEQQQPQRKRNKKNISNQILSATLCATKMKCIENFLDIINNMFTFWFGFFKWKTSYKRVLQVVKTKEFFKVLVLSVSLLGSFGIFNCGLVVPKSNSYQQ